MPRLRYSQHRRPDDRTPAERDARARTGTLDAVQGLLKAARLSVQAEPPRRAAGKQDFSERPADARVSGRAVTIEEPARREAKRVSKQVGQNVMLPLELKM